MPEKKLLVNEEALCVFIGAFASIALLFLRSTSPGVDEPIGHLHMSVMPIPSKCDPWFGL